MNFCKKISSQKQVIRQSIKRDLKEMSFAEKTRQTNWMIERLLTHKKINSSLCILAYRALNDEIDLFQILRVWIQNHWNICFPKMTPPHLEIFQCPHNFNGSFWKKNKTLSEPNPLFALKIDPKKIDCILIPGRAFDSNGIRLGRGQGYYDRFLTQVPHAYKIGVAFSCQLRTDLPHNHHDIAMDEVLICP